MKKRDKERREEIIDIEGNVALQLAETGSLEAEILKDKLLSKKATEIFYGEIEGSGGKSIIDLLLEKLVKEMLSEGHKISVNEMLQLKKLLDQEMKKSEKVEIKRDIKGETKSFLHSITTNK